MVYNIMKIQRGEKNMSEENVQDANIVDEKVNPRLLFNLQDLQVIFNIINQSKVSGEEVEYIASLKKKIQLQADQIQK